MWARLGIVGSALQVVATAADGGLWHPLRGPGRSAEETFAMHALGAGETEVRFEQRRPCERDAAPRRTLTFGVRVVAASAGPAVSVRGGTIPM